VTADYVAHEWGTFTSVQGSDGNPIPWDPFEGPSDLPGFVFRRQVPTLNTDVLCTRAAKFRQLDIKTGAWLQRMETPVIYFHSRDALDVDVHVRFPQGLLTEWFPQVSSFGPVSGVDDVLASSRESHLRWLRVRVFAKSDSDAPGAAEAIPTRPDTSHYYAARRTTANLVEATSGFSKEAQVQRDRFLFYRGAGSFPAPLRVGVEPDDRTLFLVNQGEEPLGPFFAVKVVGDEIAFTPIDPLAPGQRRTLAIPTKSAAPSALDWDREARRNVPLLHSGSARECGKVAEPSRLCTHGLQQRGYCGETPQPLSSGSWRELGTALENAMVSAGLHQDEASAMVSTWRESWFQEPGVRVLYLLPQAWTDRTLPLTLVPEPRSVVRVMVGRAEVFPRAVESRVAGLVGDFLNDDRAWAVASLRAAGMGRFLEPAITRAGQVIQRRAFANAFSCRMQPETGGVSEANWVPEQEWRRRIQEVKDAVRHAGAATDAVTTAGVR